MGVVMKKAILLFTVISMFLYVSLASAQEYVVDNFTAALYHFNEGNGTIAHDETSINNGTVNGASWVAGKFYSALNFTGGPDYTISDYVVVPDNPVLRPTDSITVEAWVNIRNVKRNAGFVGKTRFTDAEGYSGYSLGFGETLLLRFLVFDEMSKPMYVETTVPSLNTWHHIAGTYDGQYMKLYVDGDLVASKKQTGSIRQNTDPLVIGRQFGLLDIAYFSGIIDEVRISNVAREISGPVQPPCNCTNLTERVEQLEQRVNELQNKMDNLTNRVGILEVTVSNLVQIVNSLTNIVNNIIIYLTNLPPTLRQRMVCGYMENNNLTSYSDLGLTCEIRDGKRCVCSGVEASCAIADANGDGEINIFDLAMVGMNFGKMC